MTWPWLLGIPYVLIWISIAWSTLSSSVLVSIAIPVILSILTTVTDEGAESGKENFRGNAAAHRACVNFHWALMGYYVAIARGIMFPNTPTSIRDGAWGLLFVSLLFGVIGVFTLKRNAFVAPLLAVLSAAFILVLGTKLVP